MTTNTTGVGAVKRPRSNIVMSIAALCVLLGIGPFTLSRLDAQPARPAAAGYHFPVAGPHRFTNDWGVSRPGGRRHQGNDIFAAAGTPVVAVTSGKVIQRTEKVAGRSVYLLGDDGNQYYCTHLSAYGKSGRVNGGDMIGKVGNDGNAKGTSPHCHFEMRLRANGQQGGGVKVNPFETLKAWEATNQLPSNRVLLNPGFEDGPAHWGPGNGTDSMNYFVYRDDKDARTGAGFLELNTAVPGRSIAQMVRGSGKAPRAFSIWARCRSTRCEGSIVLWVVGSNKKASRSFSVGNTWTKISSPPLSPPSGTTALKVELYMTTVNTSLSVDDASLAAPAQVPS